MKSHTLDRSQYSAHLLGSRRRGLAPCWRTTSAAAWSASAHLAADLATLDAPAAILAMAGRVVQDEIHHLEVCARVLEEVDPNARLQSRGRMRPAAPAAGPRRGRAWPARW